MNLFVFNRTNLLNLSSPRLTNAELEDCLLILDDVSSSSIIQALDVGCRILVTTDDTAIMNKTNKKVCFVKVCTLYTYFIVSSFFEGNLLHLDESNFLSRFQKVSQKMKR